MPALPAVPKVLKVILKQAFVDLAGAIINRLFIQYSGTAPTDTQLDTFSGAVGTQWGADFISQCSPQVSLQGVETEDLSSATSAVGSNPENLVGTRTGGSLAASSAFVCSFEIARRYRGGHPRVYLPFGTDTDLADAGAWSSSAASGFLGAFGSFLGGVVSAGWTGAGSLTLVNVSYYSGFTNHTYPSGRTRPIPTLRGTPVVDPILSSIGRLSIGTQRRRIQFVD